MDLANQILYLTIALVSLGLIFPAYINVDNKKDILSKENYWLFMVGAQLFSALAFFLYPFAGSNFLFIGEIAQALIDVFILFYLIKTSTNQAPDKKILSIIAFMLVCFLGTHFFEYSRGLAIEMSILLTITFWKINELLKILKRERSLYIIFLLLASMLQAIIFALQIYHALENSAAVLNIAAPKNQFQEPEHELIFRMGNNVLYILIIIGIGNYQFERLQNLTKKLIIEREDQMLNVLNEIAKARDNETGLHTLRTQEFSRTLAENLYEHGHFKNELTQEFIKNLYKAAPLHDIGKVGIPDHILMKEGKLTSEEYEIMKQHASIGEKTLTASRSQEENKVLEMAITIAANHHERWDGSGYPKALRENKIPLAARIVAIADVYDALTSKRIYKKSWSLEDAKNEIIKNKGIHFDSVLVDAFEKVITDFEKIARNFRDKSIATDKGTKTILLNIA